MPSRIAIIGAGLAGLAAASNLKSAGCDVTLFEKSRGLGGRMATRRAGALQFDHGAQYFTAKGAGFQAAVAKWQTSEDAAPWFERAFVGTPGMASPARALAKGLAVISECQVAALHRTATGWWIHDLSGHLDVPGNGSFSTVVLAVPAPQAVPLVTSAGLEFPELAQVRYAPCWALMLAFDAPIELAADRMKLENGPIGWVSRNGSKPGRPEMPDCIVVHASADWSRRHLEETPATVGRTLLAEFRTLTGVQSSPTFMTAHRWRYALVEEAAGTPFLWNSTARIGACGDWCLGPRVEAAFDSGQAIAGAVLTPS